MLVTKLWSRNEAGGPRGHKAVAEEGGQNFLEAQKACLGAYLDTPRATTISIIISVTAACRESLIGDWEEQVQFLK